MNLLSHVEKAEDAVEFTDTKANRNTSEFHGQICSVTFTTNARRFTQSSIDSVQILHYRSLNLDDVQPQGTSVTPDIRHKTHGELVFRPLPNSPSENRLVVNGKSPRRILPAKSPRGN